MIEDTSGTSDGTDLQSMYPLCKCTQPSSAHSRHIRDVHSMRQSQSNFSESLSTATTHETENLEYNDMSSGDHPNDGPFPLNDSEAKIANSPKEEFTEDYLFESDDAKGIKTKREKSPSTEDTVFIESNSTSFENIHVMGSPEALMMHDPNIHHVTIPEEHDMNISGDKIPFQHEESVIEPPILLPDNGSSGKIKYPEYVQVDREPTQAATVGSTTEVPGVVPTREGRKEHHNEVKSTTATPIAVTDTATETPATDPAVVDSDDFKASTSPISTKTTSVDVITETDQWDGIIISDTDDIAVGTELYVTFADNSVELNPITDTYSETFSPTFQPPEVSTDRAMEIITENGVGSCCTCENPTETSEVEYPAVQPTVYSVAETETSSGKSDLKKQKKYLWNCCCYKIFSLRLLTTDMKLLIPRLMGFWSA